jgi:Uma2 family endonuclease
MASTVALDDRPHIGPARFTADEFLRMEALGAFAGRKVELANGQIVEEPLPGWTHARLQAWLIGLLMRAAPAGAIAVGELSVRLSELTVRSFDVGLTSPDVGDVQAAAPADVLLAVEIAVSTPAVDLNDKAAEYAAAGIPAYWVVDAVAEVVHVMSEPGPHGYAQRRVVRFTEPLATPGGGAITIA